jgi:hypothetical protein
MQYAFFSNTSGTTHKRRKSIKQWLLLTTATWTRIWALFAHYKMQRHKIETNGNNKYIKLSYFLLLCYFYSKLCKILWKKQALYFTEVVRFDVITVVKKEFEVLWIVAPCNVVTEYHHFERTMLPLSSLLKTRKPCHKSTPFKISLFVIVLGITGQIGQSQTVQ